MNTGGKWPHDGPTNILIKENSIWFIQFFAVHYEASIFCMQFYNMLLKNNNFREKFKEIEKLDHSQDEWVGFGLEIQDDNLFILAKFMLSEFMINKDVPQIEEWPGAVVYTLDLK